MRVVRDIDILDETPEQTAVMRASVAGLAVAAALTVALALTGVLRVACGSWVAVALALGLYVVSLPVHELVHAAFFTLFGRGRVRVVFGFSSGMLYAGCPGERFSRAAFLAILLAPLAFVTAALAAVGLAALHEPFLTWLLVWLHGVGCVGDLYVAAEILRHPEADVCEDTEKGVRLLASAGAEDDGAAGA